jgi:hypothetical protein
MRIFFLPPLVRLQGRRLSWRNFGIVARIAETISKFAGFGLSMKAAIYHKVWVERAGISVPRLPHREPMIEHKQAAVLAEARHSFRSNLRGAFLNAH